MDINVIKHLTELELQLLQTNREELVERLTRTVRADGVIHPLKGLHLGRISVPLEKFHSIIESSFCVIAQGSKEVLLGNQHYQYDPFHYLLTTLDLPAISQVLEASKENPCLSIRLELDPQMVTSVLVEAGYDMPARTGADVRAINVSPLDANLLDAVVRLIRLLDAPADAPILMPMIMREIIYRLLRGDQGKQLRQLSVMRGSASAIAKVVQHIRHDFDQPLRIEQLAQELGMSVSGFHYHFKAVTAMSPLQFQKHLRLQEARRLMLSENLDAASAAYRVGYNNAAHFNREYKSVFGNPPMRDIQQLRESVSLRPLL
jgi:AraC-like DNA-binding protein